MPGYGQIIQGEGNPILNNLRRNIQMVGSNVIAEKLRKKQAKEALQDKIKSALVSGILSGNIRTKEGTNLSGLNVDDDFGNMLGKMGSSFEPVPEEPMVNTTIMPYDIKDIELAEQAVNLPDEERVGGFLGTGWGLGSKTQSNKRLKEKAREILSSPGKTTTRTSGKFTGRVPSSNAGNSDVQALIEEYQTAPKARALEIEQELLRLGVNIEGL